MSASAFPAALTLTLPLALLPLFALVVGGPVGAADANPDGADGRALYEQNCLKCHQSEVYTRPDRKIASLEGLGQQVQRCESALSLRWFDDDVAAVTAYLNDTFYHFKP
jgi:mono/diheme cytochrome c family protein